MKFDPPTGPMVDKIPKTDRAAKECAELQSIVHVPQEQIRARFGLIPGHFDNPPLNAITAEQVRLNTELTAEACAHGGAVCCDAKRLRWVLEQLAKHPGVSSSARAVIEAACSPASPG